MRIAQIYSQGVDKYVTELIEVYVTELKVHVPNPPAIFKHQVYQELTSRLQSAWGPSLAAPWWARLSLLAVGSSSRVKASSTCLGSSCRTARHARTAVSGSSIRIRCSCMPYSSSMPCMAYVGRLKIKRLGKRHQNHVKGSSPLFALLALRGSGCFFTGWHVRGVVWAYWALAKLPEVPTERFSLRTSPTLPNCTGASSSKHPA